MAIFVPNIMSYNDYYPFGMLMPNRHQSSDGYRYGFQGQEMDNPPTLLGTSEIKGIGNSLNYKYRMHDPRLGRFFAVDPLTKKYPHYSPYSFSGNKVINSVELEGLEEFVTIINKDKNGYIKTIKLITFYDINDKQIKNIGFHKSGGRKSYNNSSIRIELINGQYQDNETNWNLDLERSLSLIRGNTETEKKLKHNPFYASNTYLNKDGAISENISNSTLFIAHSKKE